MRCDDCRREEERRRALTYHNRHWDGPIRNAVQHIRSGLIGDVVRVEAHWGSRSKPGDWWRTSRSISGGILYDWGVHLLEYGLQIIQSDIVEVGGYAKTGYWPANEMEERRQRGRGVRERAFPGRPVADAADLHTRLQSASRLPGDHRYRRLLRARLGVQRVFLSERRRHEDSKVPKSRGEGWRFYQNIADHLTKGAKLVITPNGRAVPSISLNWPAAARAKARRFPQSTSNGSRSRFPSTLGREAVARGMSDCPP